MVRDRDADELLDTLRDILACLEYHWGECTEACPEGHKATGEKARAILAQAGG